MDTGDYHTGVCIPLFPFSLPHSLCLAWLYVMRDDNANYLNNSAVAKETST